MDSTITVGITGGIGAGKSTACRVLDIMGYPVFYSDTQSRQILDTHPVATQQITALFGPEAYLNGKLNRPFIASRVFQHESLRNELNAIAHPLVRQAFDHWKLQQKSPVVFNEAAILFETGSYKNFDYTILVTAPQELRIQRLLARDKTNEQQIRERMATQWSDDEKQKLASFCVINDDVQPVIPQLIAILKQILP